MNYLLVGLLVLTLAATLLLGNHRARAQPPAPAITPARVPSGPLVVSTLAGHPLPDSYGDGPRLAAWFSSLRGLGLDAHGNLYVASSSEIRQVTAAGQVRTLAGSPPAQYVLLRNGFTTYGDNNPSIDGRGLGARMLPSGPLAVAPDGTVYFTETNAVRRLSPQGEVTTLGGAMWAGKADVPGDHKGGLTGRARFDQPTALVAAPDGSLYVGDREGHAVRRISPRGQVGRLSGEWKSPISPLSNEGRYISASAVAVGPDGAVYVLQGALRRYPAGGGPPVVLAGSDENDPGYVDGRGAAVRFNRPAGLCVDADGTVYVADRGNHLIRRASPDGEVTTVAGQPGVHPLHPAGFEDVLQRYCPDDNQSGVAPGQLGDYHDGPAVEAHFNHPAAVAQGPGGTLYVADQDNNCIRVIQPARP
ncbi:hypothetical protein [Hymenobacter nivis]|uniref:Gluconolaconase n=1 Tax=Hymenobacter nivis TaxID=1850093 RepID=A0A502GW72_9BACT|nr:hypothetical protein [Hymenobacter nivis]TPG65638.1 hypothetical protein EAH73_12595 [Hymenobacter nivis]